MIGNTRNSFAFEGVLVNEARSFDMRFCIHFCYALRIFNNVVDRLAKYAINCKTESFLTH